MSTAVKSLPNELQPAKPLNPWTQPPNTIRYKVKTGDSWVTLGARNNVEYGEELLIWINFKLTPLDHRWTDQVNWYLRKYVGCKHSRDGGRNWAFTNDANPGYIFLPDMNYRFDPHVITGKRGTGGVGAPQYSDENAFDTISKALDIYGTVDSGLAMSGVALPALIEVGFIVTGALAGIIGPALSIGGPHNDALRKTARDYFFDGFCRTLVMRADSWSEHLVKAFYPALQYPPLNPVYPEKRESFRKLYNFGLKAGLLQANRMNVEDVRNLFVLLRNQLTAHEEAKYSGTVAEIQAWSTEKKKEYYLRLSSILKQIIIEKNLKVKFS